MICPSRCLAELPKPIPFPLQERILVVPAQVPPAIRTALRGAGESKAAECQGGGRIPEHGHHQPRQRQQAAGEATPLLRGGASQGDEFRPGRRHSQPPPHPPWYSTVRPILVTFSFFPPFLMAHRFRKRKLCTRRASTTPTSGGKNWRKYERGSSPIFGSSFTKGTRC